MDTIRGKEKTLTQAVTVTFTCLIFLVCLYLLPLSLHAACSVVDDAGQTIVLKQPAQRIITLAPDITETLYALTAENQIIATVSASDYPPPAKKLKRIGSYAGLDSEAMLALQPDLIIAWGPQFAATLARFKRLAIPVYVSQPKQLADIPATMRRFGCLTGKTLVAEKLAKQFTQQLEVLKQRYAQRKPKTVFFQVGAYSLLTVNKDSWINQVIELCGGRNLYAEAKWLAAPVTMEAVVASNPEVIICDADNSQWRERWLAFKDLSAVRYDRLITVQPDLIDRAGPRLLQGAEFICRKI